MSKDRQYSLDLSEHPLTEAEKQRERIPRQISVVYPIRTVYGETRLSDLAEQVRTGEREFLERGVTALIRSDKDAETLALTVARMRYGVDNVLFHDLGVGIHTALTRPNSGIQLLDVNHLRRDDDKIEKTVVTVSLAGLFKLALGPLVDDNGRAITGAGPVVKEMKNRLRAVLYAVNPEPIAAVSINKDGERIVIHGKPIIIDKWRSDAFQIQIDHYFFPMVEKEDELKIKELYIHQVAGLASVLSFGRYLLSQGQKTNYPKTTDAHKLLLYMQAASEMAKFAPNIIKRHGEGRYNFVFRRNTTVKDLRPSAISSQGRIRYKDFSAFVGKSGHMYLKALEELGVIDDLAADTLIPAIERGAEFPDEYSREVVYVKAEHLPK